MAILKIEGSFGRPARHIVVMPSEQERQGPIDPEVLEEEQRRMVDNLDQRIPTAAEIAQEQERNRAAHG